MISLPTGEDHDDVVGELIAQQDLHHAFSYVLRNKHVDPSPDHATALLNNLNTLAEAGSPSDVGRFYKRLALPSYGSCADDGSPLAGVDLPRLESLVAVDPQFLLHATALDEATFTSLTIPHEFGEKPCAEVRKERLAAKGGAAACLAALQIATAVSATGDAAGAVGNVAITAALAAALIVAESPAFLNGAMGRAAGWARESLAHALDPAARERTAQHDASTFVVAYLLGCPVQTVATDPSDPATHRRFRYPDAPRVDLRDPALQVLDNAAQIDVAGLKRLATVHLAAAAADALSGGRFTPHLTDYTKILLAALAQRASNGLFSTILHAEFPHRLLPTLARYAFVEAVLILREAHATGAVDAVRAAFAAGGGVGDAIRALESCVAKVPVDERPAVARRTALAAARERAADVAERNNEFSAYFTLQTLAAARATPTPAPESFDAIEYIKGTDRVYTREELILPRNPSPAQVKELAREVMNLKMSADKVATGRVSQKTRGEVQALAADVAAALHVYEGQRAAAGTPPPSSSTSSAAVASSSAAAPAAPAAVDVQAQAMLDALGLTAEHLQAFPAAVRPGILEPAVELLALKQAAWEAFVRVEASWVFKWKIVFEHFTGLAMVQSVDHVWDATNLSTGIETPPPPKKGTGRMARLIDTREELEALVERLAYQPPSGDGRGGGNGGVLGIPGLRGLKVVPLSPAEMVQLAASAAPTAMAAEGPDTTGAMEGAPTSVPFQADASDDDATALKRALAEKLFAGFAAAAAGEEEAAEEGAEGGSAAATGFSFDLSSGVEVYLESDDGMWEAFDGVSAAPAEAQQPQDQEQESVAAVSEPDDVGVPVTSPATVMLQTHAGAAHSLVEARARQARRDAAACDARLEAMRARTTTTTATATTAVKA